MLKNWRKTYWMEVGNHRAKQELISPNWIHTVPYIGVSLFEKSFFKMFSVHTKTQCQHFDQIYSLTNVWRKIRLRWIIWRDECRIKLRFLIPLSVDINLSYRSCTYIRRKFSVYSFGRTRIRISDPRSLGSWCINWWNRWIHSGQRFIASFDAPLVIRVIPAGSLILQGPFLRDPSKYRTRQLFCLHLRSRFH